MRGEKRQIKPEPPGYSTQNSNDRSTFKLNFLSHQKLHVQLQAK